MVSYYMYVKIRESLFKYEEYDFGLDMLTILTFFVNSARCQQKSMEEA
jgi:hypothetical protein